VRSDVHLVRIRSERPASRTVMIATRAKTQAAEAAAFAERLHETAARLAMDLETRLTR
jgi:hypothetical protein